MLPRSVTGRFSYGGIGNYFDAALPFWLKAPVLFVTTNPKSRFTQRVRTAVSLFLVVAAGLVPLGRMAMAMALGQNDRIQGECDPVVIPQFFDGVTPRALPPGWSSTTWVTSNSGLPSPPADSLANPAFVDDLATISDKQLLSPSIPVVADGSPRTNVFPQQLQLAGWL